MKNIIYLCFFTLLFLSCKPTSNIITSKEIAEKKGIYSKPITSNTSDAKPALKKKKDLISRPVIKNTTTSKAYNINDKNETDITVDHDNTSYLVSQIINAASDNLGVGYRSGGTSKEGFDCSGLIYSTFRKFDIELPRSSYEMAEVGSKIAFENAKKGDLIFFINRGQRRINHVGMIVEINDDEIKFIHSSTQSGVIVSSTNEPYYKRTFAQINRILE